MSTQTDDSKYRVALEVAEKIYRTEYPAMSVPNKDEAREYWLRLYGDCLEAINGNADNIIAMVKKRNGDQ